MKQDSSRFGRWIFRSGLALAVPLFFSQCEKAKQLAEQAKAASETAAAEKEDAEVDADLQGLVDQNAEGVVFRKDLPFPMDLEVEHELKLIMQQVRSLKQSPFGNQGATMSGEVITRGLIERFPGAVRVTIHPQQILMDQGQNPADTPADASQPAVEPGETAIENPGKPMVFRYDGKGWKIEKTGIFSADSAAADLREDLPIFLTTFGAAPRPLWFAARRYKIGDRVELKGQSLGVLVDAAESGELSLTLEAIEPANGHPCGKFKIEGDFKQMGLMMGGGSNFDTDITITDGHVWVSLIYPLVIREDYQTVQTMKMGTGGEQLHLQGAMQVKIERRWNVVDR
ncbi:MAG: hypothetical protein MUF31_02265 [Akkermansiaceae bacterium]|jgi:hypothetical protein|nr:hypothetical protein [Akkermansiaceae bacterium]